MTAEKIRLKIKALIIPALIRFAITFPFTCVFIHTCYFTYNRKTSSFGRKSFGFKDYYFL